MSGPRNDERTLDLLAARATQALDAVETAELQKLLAAAPDIEEDGFDLAAAAVDLAFFSLEAKPESMPEELRGKIVSDAVRQLQPGLDPVVTPFPERSRNKTASLGWLAAAAMFLLALLGWMRSVPPGALQPLPAPTLAEQYRTFVEGSVDLLRVAWAAPEDPEFAGVEGDVVWSTTAQTGFMRLRGMPANDPEVRQYQLWIVDPGRDVEPVDGGVFDVPAGQTEVIVPIDSKLAVLSPAAFAITVEQPGGVVVSEGPLRVVAPVSS